MMASSDFHPLIPGSIKDIIEGQKLPSIWLQIIFIKPVEKESGGMVGSGGPKFKVAVSDSKNFIQAMVVPPLSHLIEQKALVQYSIIRVTSYTLTNAKGHTFLVIGNMAPEDHIQAGSKYGEPTNIEQHLKAISSANDVPLGTTITSGLPPTGMSTYNNNTSNIANATYQSHPSVHSTTATVPQSNTPASLSSNPFHSNISKFAESGLSSSSTPMTSGAVGYYEEPEALQSIANLSPYNNRWAIKARIVNKTEVKRFANAKGEGKLFSVTCIDGSGEIRMTAFGELVDKFYDLIAEGQVYFISQAQVRIAKRQFGIRNEYEIHLEANSLIQPARDSEEVPLLKYNFIPISQVVNLEKDANCDVIGVAKEVGELGSITTRTTQKQTNKRDITLVDTSGCAIRLTLWGTQAENFTFGDGMCPVVAVRGARVSDYNGRTLSASASSTITINPDIREAHELRGWYDARGVNQEARSVTIASTTPSFGGAGSKEERKYIAQIKEEHLGQGERPDYFSTYATITFIKSDTAISYMACPGENCSKKVIEEGPFMYRCEKCQKVYDHCDYRYILSLQIGDHTGQTWVNAFNETGQSILGKTAQEMHYLKSNETEYNAVIKEATFKSYLFRLRAKQESYQGETKLRINVMAVVPVNAEEECKYLVEQMEK